MSAMGCSELLFDTNAVLDFFVQHLNECATILWQKLLPRRLSMTLMLSCQFNL